jgi:large subunit ribosomal protein L17
MRHHVDGRKLNMTSSHRKAMFANMASSLVIHDRIETTLPKAKELRRIADRLVTLGKRNTVHARRQAFALIKDRQAVVKIFGDLAGRFADRNGGYTRIYKLGCRHGDRAPMAIIEYLTKDGGTQLKEAKTGGKDKVKAKAKAKVEKKNKVKAKVEKKTEMTKEAASKKKASKNTRNTKRPPLKKSSTNDK